MVRVLVVDDQAPFRVAARAVLKRTVGFSLVGEAVSGDEAMSRAAELHPDLVLMDVYLGDRAGVEVTSELTAADPALVVVLISTHPLDELPADARSCGARGYLNKAQLTPQVLRSLWDRRDDQSFAWT